MDHTVVRMTLSCNNRTLRFAKTWVRLNKLSESNEFSTSKQKQNSAVVTDFSYFSWKVHHTCFKINYFHLEGWNIPLIFIPCLMKFTPIWVLRIKGLKPSVQRLMKLIGLTLYNSNIWLIRARCHIKWKWLTSLNTHNRTYNHPHTIDHHFQACGYD